MINDAALNENMMENQAESTSRLQIDLNGNAI